MFQLLLKGGDKDAAVRTGILLLLSDFLVCFFKYLLYIVWFILFPTYMFFPFYHLFPFYCSGISLATIIILLGEKLKKKIAYLPKTYTRKSGPLFKPLSCLDGKNNFGKFNYYFYMVYKFPWMPNKI